MRERRELIISTVKDLVADFLYYDRKEDEELKSSDIQDAVALGEISIEEIIDTFKSSLKERTNTP